MKGWSICNDCGSRTNLIPYDNRGRAVCSRCWRSLGYWAYHRDCWNPNEWTAADTVARLQREAKTMGAISTEPQVISAARRPETIKVQQVQEDALPLCVQRREDGSLFVRNELHNTDVNVKPGDYVRVDKAGDVYPISEADFHAQFDVTPPTE